VKLTYADNKMQQLIAVFVVLVAIGSVAGQGRIVKSDVERANGETVPGTDWKVIFFSDFRLDNNIWGIVNAQATFEQAIYIYDSGQFGYNWTRVSSSSKQLTYPSVFYGASPWGEACCEPATTPNLPVPVQNLHSLIVTQDFEHVVTDHNGNSTWDFAYDIWLTSKKPDGTDVSSTITDEVMVWFGWNSNAWTPTAVEKNAVNDGFNVYDYTATWQNNPSRYHQFRITGAQRIPDKVNLQPFLAYVVKRYNRPQIWLADIELGDEVNDGTQGHVLFKKLEYQVQLV